MTGWTLRSLAIAFFAVVLTAPLSGAFAQTEPAAGSVSSVDGKIYILRGSERIEVRSGAPVRAGDTLVQSQGSSAILFTDGSSLLLKPKSQVSVVAYNFDQATKTGGLVLELGTGAFRFSSGVMPSSAYQLLTAGGERVVLEGTVVELTILQAATGGFNVTATVVSGAVTVGGTTFAAGQSFVFALSQSGALVAGSVAATTTTASAAAIAAGIAPTVVSSAAASGGAFGMGALGTGLAVGGGAAVIGGVAAGLGGGGGGGGTSTTTTTTTTTTTSTSTTP